MIRPSAPFNILIVEDEALLAMDLEGMIEDSGHHVIAQAMSLHDLIAMEQLPPPDLAFVDLQLAEECSGLEVCAHIQIRWAQTAIVFVTANPKKLPDDFAGAHGVIPKPFSRSGILSAMRYLGEGISDPPPTCGRPPSFIPAPTIAQEWGDDP